MFCHYKFYEVFSDWPTFLFEKDSCSYLTEKEGTGRPERTIQNFEKFKTASKNVNYCSSGPRVLKYL